MSKPISFQSATHVVRHVIGIDARCQTARDRDTQTLTETETRRQIQRLRRTFRHPGTGRKVERLGGSG
eukprot:2653793-Rhodomonas_salina.1